jgi:hypothetical protein
MKRTQYELDLVARACQGDGQAADFVWRALDYFHAGDDLVDEDLTPEARLAVLVRAQELFTHAFFLRHGHALNAVLRGIESTYADSVAWERSEDEDKRAWAEHARHCGWEVILAVADLCGGWEHRRAISREVRRYQLSCAAEDKPSVKG